jgi:hypothetical protein
MTVYREGWVPPKGTVLSGRVKRSAGPDPALKHRAIQIPPFGRLKRARRVGRRLDPRVGDQDVVLGATGRKRPP